MTTAWNNCHFILSERLDFHMVNNLLIADHTFLIHILTLLSVDKTLLPRYINLCTHFKGLPFNMEMAPPCLKCMNFVLSEFNSLIMWLIVSSLSPHNLHLLFCCVLSILALIWLVLMALSCAAIRRDSVSLLRFRRCPRGVMVKAMDYRIVIREFVLQSRYYVHFQANTLGKGGNPLILPAMG